MLFRLILFSVMFFDCVDHAVESGFYYRAGHCKVESDIPCSVANE